MIGPGSITAALNR